MAQQVKLLAAQAWLLGSVPQHPHEGEWRGTDTIALSSDLPVCAVQASALKLRHRDTS